MLVSPQVLEVMNIFLCLMLGGLLFNSIQKNREKTAHEKNENFDQIGPYKKHIVVLDLNIFHFLKSRTFRHFKEHTGYTSLGLNHSKS